ncbi:MAG: hypothetical protein V4858_09490 [Pseudomonadota bacterium]
MWSVALRKLPAMHISQKNLNEIIGLLGQRNSVACGMPIAVSVEAEKAASGVCESGGEAPISMGEELGFAMRARWDRRLAREKRREEKRRDCRWSLV